MANAALGMAEQLRRIRLPRLQTAICLKSFLTDLDHQPSGSGCGQRAIHGHKCHFGIAAILSVDPVIGHGVNMSFWKREYDCYIILGSCGTPWLYSEWMPLAELLSPITKACRSKGVLHDVSAGHPCGG
jgi:hypothetical protein